MAASRERVDFKTGITTVRSDGELSLLVSKNHNRCSSEPEVSIVVPALNEELTVEEFIGWCWEGLDSANVAGEVIIVDSSDDMTAEKALRAGAKVLSAPKRGLGRAYIDASNFISGNLIIMGDCDLTYDFRRLNAFVEAYKSGYEYIMGSRFKGHIEDGAMPKLHRYFGTPFTTWLLNTIYKSHFSDIHCGMRAITRPAFFKIDLTSQGWEYASELVLKSVRLNLKTKEVPVWFYKDREGRESHLKRGGFLTPWVAGWINLKVMLVYSPDSFLIKPGFFLFVIGLMTGLSGFLSSENQLLSHYSSKAIFLMLVFTTFGYALFQTGVLARYRHRLRNGIESQIVRMLSYNWGMLISFILFVVGMSFFYSAIMNESVSIKNTFGLDVTASTGLCALLLSIQTFSFTLLIEMERRIRKLPRI